MTTYINLKHLWGAVSLVSILSATSALAQTHVSARVNMSGSCASCDLSDRDMPRISLQDSNFSNSDFSRSNLSGGTFHRSNLQGASFHKSYLMRVKGGNINMRNAVLRGSTLVECELVNSDISHADLRQADLSGGDFHKSRFMFSNLIGSDAMNAHFVASDFSHAKLDHSDFTDAVFDKAIFAKADFGDADVSQASFLEADLSGANLTRVQGLTQEQIEYACGDAHTKLPKGLKVKTCVYSVPQNVSLLSPYPAVTSPSGPPPVVSAHNHNRAVLEFIASPKYAALQQQKQTLNVALNEALKNIDDVLKDLPIESPSRKKLTKARHSIEQLQSHQHTRILVKAPE